MMGLTELLAWQWSDYAEKHRDRTNLLVHIVAVPLFIGSTIGLAVAILRFAIGPVVAAVVGLALSLFLQGRGHARERSAPEPFRGHADFVRRILAEQFITFPRFVATGSWVRNLRDRE